jgi:hypothetical protein
MPCDLVAVCKLAWDREARKEVCHPRYGERKKNRGELSAPLRCALALQREEGSFSLLTLHLRLSSRARLGDMPGYYQTSRWRRTGVW